MEKRILSNVEVNNIYKAIGNDFGFCEEIKETFCDWCYNWKSDAYTWSADAAFFMLYDCGNYDNGTKSYSLISYNDSNKEIFRKRTAIVYIENYNY